MKNCCIFHKIFPFIFYIFLHPFRFIEFTLSVNITVRFRINEYPVVLFDVYYNVYDIGCRWFFGHVITEQLCSLLLCAIEAGDLLDSVKKRPDR